MRCLRILMRRATPRRWSWQIAAADHRDNTGTDEYGYLEAFTRDFKPESNEKLSENGVMAEKTMNTLLHVFEAYTELYRVTKDPFTR